MKGKNFEKELAGYFRMDSPNQNEECDSDDTHDLTAEKVFFSGLTKKLPVMEQSTLSKITKVSLVKNSI